MVTTSIFVDVSPEVLPDIPLDISQKILSKILLCTLLTIISVSSLCIIQGFPRFFLTGFFMDSTKIFVKKFVGFSQKLLKKVFQLYLQKFLEWYFQRSHGFLPNIFSMMTTSIFAGVSLEVHLDILPEISQEIPSKLPFDMCMYSFDKSFSFFQ